MIWYPFYYCMDTEKDGLAEAYQILRHVNANFEI